MKNSWPPSGSTASDVPIPGKGIGEGYWCSSAGKTFVVGAAAGHVTKKSRQKPGERSTGGDNEGPEREKGDGGPARVKLAPQLMAVVLSNAHDIRTRKEKVVAEEAQKGIVHERTT